MLKDFFNKKWVKIFVIVYRLKNYDLKIKMTVAFFVSRDVKFSKNVQKWEKVKFASKKWNFVTENISLKNKNYL